MRRLPVIRKKSFFLVIPLSLVLLLALAACGAGSTGGSGSGSGSGATSAPTTVKGYGTAQGCPSDAVVTTAPTAGVTVHVTQSHSTVTAHTGDVVQFDLPFGQRWSGPTGSVGSLEMQTPSGYADKTNKVCVWRFVAKGTGTTMVSFYGRAICLKGQLCPQYVMTVPFEVSIK